IPADELGARLAFRVRALRRLLPGAPAPRQGRRAHHAGHQRRRREHPFRLDRPRHGARSLERVGHRAEASLGGDRQPSRIRIAGVDPVENIQHRPEFARPPNGLTNQTVRQAFYQALDRQAIVDVDTAGLGTVADSWIAPTDEIRPQVEASIPKYPYDPARAQQVLAQVGWVRGADGI